MATPEIAKALRGISAVGSQSAAKSQDSRRPSVIVVGGGMAGIAAARRLADHGYDITVLEANPSRYGGRIQSFEVPGTGGKVADMGAMWIHGGADPEHPLTRLCQQYGIPIKEYHIWKPENVMAFDEEGRRLSEEEQEQIITAVLRLEEILEEAQTRLEGAKLSDISIRTLMAQAAKEDPEFANQEAVRHVAIPALESYDAATIDDLSVKFFHGVPNSPEHVEFLGEDMIIPAGYKTLLDRIATTGPRFPILLDRRVEQITVDRNASKVNVVSFDQRNRRFETSAEHVVVAVPLGVLKARSVHFEPALPSSHMRAIDRIGFGVKVKVLLVYDEAFWPNSEIFYVKSKEWPMFLMNLKKVNGMNALITTLDPVESNRAETMSDTALVEIVADRLARIVGPEKMSNARLVYSKVTKWNSDLLIRGAYSFGKIGMSSEDAYAIRQPVSPYLFFAGEHTQFPEGEPGTVHVAYMSGQRAADEIMVLHRLEGPVKNVHFGIDKAGVISKL